MAKSGSNEIEEEVTWRGSPLNRIHRKLTEFELELSPPLTISEDHTIWFNIPLDVLPPCPRKGETKWDWRHVRLPSSVESECPLDFESEHNGVRSRWDVIKEALSHPITNSKELKKAILIYNYSYREKWSFKALHRLFKDELKREESKDFLEKLLPRIIRLALQMPDLIQAPIPLLLQKLNHSISLSQQQISCLLANAFLCTFPSRNSFKNGVESREYITFPSINFHRLFESTRKVVLEKIKCLLHYFRRVCPTNTINENIPTGVVTFKRLSLDQTLLYNWTNCNNIYICDLQLHVDSDGTIEDGKGLLQVNFTDKRIGGGVLNTACKNEEIRFLICPELIVSRLFTEFLRSSDVLFIIGCEQYSNYTGYSNSFKWAGNHEDLTPYDGSRRRMRHIVAMRDLSFREPKQQYRKEVILLELNRAYMGFYHDLKTPAPSIATGLSHGPHSGDIYLKALLQLIACTAARRPMVYYTFGDRVLRNALYHIHRYLSYERITVCNLCMLLLEFPSKSLPSEHVYNYLRRRLEGRFITLSSINNK